MESGTMTIGKTEHQRSYLYKAAFIIGCYRTTHNNLMTPGAIKRLRIISVIDETAEAKTFVLQQLDGWEPTYESGQFITLVFETKHGEKRRSFSISSSPTSNEPLSISIKKVDNGEFSRLLIYFAKPGDILLSSGINGFFVLPAKKMEQYFFLAAGSGITPCFSLIKTLLITQTMPVVLIYSNSTEADAMFYTKLTLLQEEHPAQLTIRFLFSDRFDVHHSRLSNWLLQQLLKQYLVTTIDNAVFFICGPFDYMLMVDITLKAARVPAAHIIKENFSSLPRPVIARPPDTDAYEVELRINHENHILTVQYPQTILAAAKKKHISLPYSCEAGRCGSCVANIISGKVWMAYNEVLMDEEIEKGSVLTCQGYPVGGNVILEVV